MVLGHGGRRAGRGLGRSALAYLLHGLTPATPHSTFECISIYCSALLLYYYYCLSCCDVDQTQSSVDCECIRFHATLGDPD